MYTKQKYAVRMVSTRMSGSGCCNRLVVFQNGSIEEGVTQHSIQNEPGYEAALTQHEANTQDSSTVNETKSEDQSKRTSMQR